MATLTINGESRSIKASPDTPLLYVLRDELGHECREVRMRSRSVRSLHRHGRQQGRFSCITPVMLLQSRTITTLEGLGTVEAPGPLQRAFIAEQAAQCGFCIPALMMRAQALLNRVPHATDQSIRAELQPHLCRCGTHMRILRAVRRAAEDMKPKTAEARTER